MVGKTGNTIPTAPRTSVIVPAIKKRTRASLLLLVLLFVLGSCCIAITDGLTILKCLLFSGKNAVLFTHFAKNGVCYRTNDGSIFISRVAAERDNSLTPSIASTLFLRSPRCSKLRALTTATMLYSPVFCRT